MPSQITHGQAGAAEPPFPNQHLTYNIHLILETISLGTLLAFSFIPRTFHTQCNKQVLVLRFRHLGNNFYFIIYFLYMSALYHFHPAPSNFSSVLPAPSQIHELI